MTSKPRRSPPSAPRLRWWPLVLAVLALGTAEAQAGEAEDRARAEAVFLEAQKLFDAGRIEAACAKFEESLAIARTAGALVNLARCHAAQGRTATAWREYQEGAKLAAEVGQDERAKRAAELASELEPRLSKLTIAMPAGAPEGLSVSRNGTPVASDELGVAVPVDPGSFRIVARAPGREAWETTVQVKPEGDSVVVEVAFPSGQAGPEKGQEAPNAPPPVPSDPSDEGGLSSTQIAGLAIGGVGVASAVVGGILGAVTLSSVSDAESDDALCGADQLCTPAGVDQIDSARTTGVVSTVLLGVGVAAVGTGIVLFSIGGDAPTSEGARVRPRVGGLEIDARF